MIPRRQAFRIPAVLARLALLAALAAPEAARAAGIDTILRRPAEDGAVPARVDLGPTRSQGDFAAHLDDLLAAAPPESSLVPPGARIGAAAGQERQPIIVLPVLAGAAGGAAGLYGGVALALALNENDEEWEDVLEAIAVGLAGEVVLLPLGVHLGNGRKGSFAADLGVSALSALAGLGLMSVSGGSTEGAIAGAALQLGAVVYTERSRGARQIAVRRAAESP